MDLGCILLCKIVTERENNVLMYVCKYMHVWIQYNVKKGEQETLNTGEEGLSAENEDKS